MHSIALIDEDGRPVCETCRIADSWFARARGLIGSAPLAEGEGLLISPCHAVHTWFMRFPIDVVFLDADLRVLDVAPSLEPWSAARRRRAETVLELAAGTARKLGIEAGATLAWGEVQAAA